MRKAAVIAVLSFCALTAAAQDYYRYFEQERPLLSTEWGAGISGTYTGISSGDEQIGFSPRIGYGAYIGMSLCVGRHFALHAEIDYHFGNLLVTRGDISRKVKSRSIEMPILLTFRGVDRLRFSVGPVIAVMDRSRYDDDTETIEFGAVRPTWNVAVGAGVTLGRRCLLEARYTRALQRTLNQFDGHEFRSDSYRVVLSLGLLF